MNEEFGLYTGTVNYNDIVFTFAFSKNELRLIPPDDVKEKIRNGLLRKRNTSDSEHDEPFKIETPFLIGQCNEINKKIIFFPNDYSSQGIIFDIYNNAINVDLLAYVICDSNYDNVDSMSFECPEINCIHSWNGTFPKIIEISDYETNDTMPFFISRIRDFETKKQIFYFDDKEITVYFNILRKSSNRIDRPAISFESSLIFEFKPIKDYLLVFKLLRIAREFISFLCYRKNVYIPKIGLYATKNDLKHTFYGTMYFLEEDGETEISALNEGRYIRQEYISGHEGQILSDIANGQLYLRHLPETCRLGQYSDAARFVMLTAAFEWEFRRYYNNKIIKSEDTIIAENKVYDRIEKLISETTGKEKDIYKFLKKLVERDSLQRKIVQIGEDFSDILDVFGNRLYKLYNQVFKYSIIGERISSQRNNYAHGNLDKEFIGPSLLDIIFVKYIIYAIQLKYYGVDNINIQKAINDLFNLGFIFKDTNEEEHNN